MKKLEHIIEPIRAELAQFEAFFEKTLHAETEPMDSILQYVLDSRGKRLRPILVLLSANGLDDMLQFFHVAKIGNNFARYLLILRLY